MVSQRKRPFPMRAENGGIKELSLLNKKIIHSVPRIEALTTVHAVGILLLELDYFKFLHGRIEPANQTPKYTNKIFISIFFTR